MEVADALYGVSMRGDGITTVISQRLRGTDLAAPRRPMRMLVRRHPHPR